MDSQMEGIDTALIGRVSIKLDQVQFSSHSIQFNSVLTCCLRCHYKLFILDYEIKVYNHSIKSIVKCKVKAEV